MNQLDRLESVFPVIVEVRQQIDFIEKGGMALPEHQWVFCGFILSFGYAQHHHPTVFADIEFRRANQITDILHNQQVNVIKFDTIKSLLYNVGRQMAVTPKLVGVDLNNRCTAAGQAVGIVGRADITNDHSASDFRHNAGQGFFEGRGFSGTGATHHVEYIYVFFLKQLTVLGSHDVIGIQNPAHNLDLLSTGSIGRPPPARAIFMTMTGPVRTGMVAVMANNELFTG
jgi:hypothetical protein